MDSVMHCRFKCLLLGLVCHPVSIKVMLDVHIVGVCLGESKNSAIYQVIRDPGYKV